MMKSWKAPLVLLVTAITPLVFLLAYRLLYAEMAAPEYWLTVVVFLINGVSLVFDFYDLKQWRKGNRQVAGYENEIVRF